MRNVYTERDESGRVTRLLAVIVIAFASTMAFAQQGKAQTPDCSTNYFSSEITSQELDSTCITRTIAVHVASGNKYALSHFVVEMPSCGVITQASNTGGWPILLNSTDPKSGLYGLKVDEVNNFGDGGAANTFYLTYTMCSTNSECLKAISSEPFQVVYKFATCQYFDTLTPVIITPLKATIEASPVLCNGTATGTVTTHITSGTAPFTYLWNTGDTTPTLTSVSSGSYSVLITDANNQQLLLEAQITEPLSLTLSGSSTATACNEPTGTITTLVNGGTEPYRYSWSSGDTTANLANLKAGIYTVKVTDANGCFRNRSFTIVQNSSLNVTLTGSVLECHQEGEGTVTSQVTGGTAPYQFIWSTGDTTHNINQLNTGRYQITVTDDLGCTATKGAYVTIKQLLASAKVTSPLCKGDSTGTATLNIYNGTAPYNVSWSTGDTTTAITNVASGWYTAVITDANGCEYQRTINISDPKPLTINATMTRQSCAEEDSLVNITLSGTGGTSPYTWMVNGTTSEASFIGTLNDTIPVTMTDINGCNTEQPIVVTASDQSISVTTNVTQPTCQNTSGSVVVTATGGVAPYTILWDDDSTTFERINLNPGKHTAIIYDSRGCSNSTSININDIKLPSININQPDNQPLCETANNILTANAENVVSSNWTVTSTNNNWLITNDSLTVVTYQSGTGVATFTVTGTSTDGCIAADTILVECTAIPTDTTTTDPEDNDGPCGFFDSYNTSLISMTADEWGCVDFRFRVSTDGLADHELSHLVIGIDEGQLQDATITRNWPVETNMRDPKSGVYGFKVDNIDGFGQSGTDSFEINFTVCYGSTIPETFSFPIVYKAATCQDFDTLTITHPAETGLNLMVYPNPFVDQCTFDVTSKSNTNIEINIFDSKGNKIQTLCKTQIVSGLTYKWSFDGGNSGDNLFFYQLLSPEGNKQGKILRIK